MCIADYDGEPAAFYHRDMIQRARKPHRCDECFRTIAAGESYERVGAKWEGEVCTHRTCGHCLAARAWLDEVCGGWMHGMICEDLSEHLHDYRSLWLGRVVYGMERKWARKDGTMMAPPKPFGKRQTLATWERHRAAAEVR